MGALPSKSQLNRTKTLSFGRSSQKGSFHRSKAKLKDVSNKIEAFDRTENAEVREDIKKTLDDIERDLNDALTTVKVKHQLKYDEVKKHLEEIREKFEGQLSTTQQNITEVQEAQKPEKGVKRKFSFVRSSQRGLFQKVKGKLKEIDKKLHDLDVTDVVLHECIRKQLEDIDKELSAVSAVLKDKNKKQCEEVLTHLAKTKEVFENELKPLRAVQEVEQEQPSTAKLNISSSPKTVELKLVKVVASVENSDDDVEIRKHRQDEEKRQVNTIDVAVESPKVKFGVQVMPNSPKISQKLLKRNTLPDNVGPKAEFEQIRVISDSALLNHKKPLVMKENELYNVDMLKVRPPSNGDMENSNKIYSIPYSSEEENQRISIPPKKPPRVLKEASVEETALEQIESICNYIDDLEGKLKYFHGTKGDKEYIVLHESLVRSIINLDNIETGGDAVVKLERKIAVQRIQELIAILESLVEVPGINDYSDSDEGTSCDPVPDRREEIVNAEGRVVAATAL